ncbi:MAG: Gfo/Idh/MocA family oxidoreductase [Fidelibacterota bacterium]|nr:MAG: Gfo/Idh/MocA family oxidoreductase [Candidatus Neomarinimicrobiota bacterium]
MIAIDPNTPRLALIGCGAIAESFYLPALARHQNVMDQLILVDRDLARLDLLGNQHGIDRRETDYQRILGEVDGAIVATPPALHHQISMAFLQSGSHILCDKPLAEDGQQVHEMKTQAEEAGTHILVNNTRRLFPSSRRIKELIDTGTIGKLRSIEYHEGGPFSWPTVSGFYFDTKKNSKGITQDRGAHVFDLVCWWLGTKPTILDYKDDSYGGPEAVAELTFSTSECQGVVKMSLLNKLSNRYVIKGESGSITGDVYDRLQFMITTHTGQSRTVKVPSKVRYFNDLAFELVDNFIQIIRGQATPLISATDVIPSIQLIDECYANRTRFDLPWITDRR